MWGASMTLGSSGGAHIPELGDPRVQSAHPEPEEAIAGDRGIPSVNRVRSLQSRVSSFLGIALVTTLGVGLLTWYYTKALTRPAQAQHAAQAAAKTHAQGEMALPSLGPIRSPVAHVDATSAPAAPDQNALERALGPHPPYPRRRPPVWRRRDWLHPHRQGNHRNRLQSLPSSAASQVLRSHGPQPMAGPEGPVRCRFQIPCMPPPTPKASQRELIPRPDWVACYVRR